MKQQRILSLLLALALFVTLLPQTALPVRAEASEILTDGTYNYRINPYNEGTVYLVGLHEGASVSGAVVLPSYYESYSVSGVFLHSLPGVTKLVLPEKMIAFSEYYFSLSDFPDLQCLVIQANTTGTSFEYSDCPALTDIIVLGKRDQVIWPRPLRSPYPVNLYSDVDIENTQTEFKGTVLYPLSDLHYDPVWAEEQTEGDFSYILADGKATVTAAPQSGSVTIPATLGGAPVCYLQPHLFHDATITGLSLPDTVEELSYRCCEGCASLEAVDLSHIQRVGVRSFYGCAGLQALTLSENCAWVGRDAFRSCGLKTIPLPEGLTHIGMYAFAENLACTEFTLPQTLTELGQHAFEHTQTDDLVIPDGVTKLWEATFAGSARVSVTLPQTLEYVSGSPLKDCVCDTLVVPGSLQTIDYGGFAGVLAKRIVVQEGVEELDTLAFADASEAVAIELPESVKTIGMSAFMGCTSLREIVLPNQVTVINSYTFSNCQALESVKLPFQLTTIDKYAFSNCKSLRALTVPDSVTSFKGAFTDSGIGLIYGRGEQLAREALLAGIRFIDLDTGEEYTVHETTIQNVTYRVWTFGTDVLDGKNAAGAVTIPAAVDGVPVTRVQKSAFYQNKKLTSLVLPDGLVKIDAFAFMGCDKLTSVRFPESLKSIGSSAFSHCSNLSDFHVPFGIEEIGGFAFAYCPGLRMLYLSPDFRTDLLYGFPGEPETVQAIADDVTLVYVPGTPGEQYYNDLQKVHSSVYGYALPENSPLVLSENGIYRLDTDHATLIFTPPATAEFPTVFVSPYAGGLPVTNIAANALQVHKDGGFTCFVILPPTVTTVEAGAFDNLTENETNIYIPASVTEIAPDALPQNTGLWVIYGARGSTAQAFAKQHGIPFREEYVEMLPFTDVKAGTWYYMPVLYAYYNGLMSGVSSSKFSPTVTMTRAMLVQVLYNLAGSPSESYGFRDVPENAWYADAVNWAANNGIVAGTSETTFSPNANITREQVATILYRFASKLGPVEASADALQGFRDADKVSDFAVEAMRWAVTKGLIQGTASNRLSPKGNATRAEVAAILQRFVTLLLTETPQTRGASPVFPDLQQFQKAVNLDL